MNGGYYIEKRKRLDQPRQALEDRPVKSFFDFIGGPNSKSGGDCSTPKSAGGPDREVVL
ncbi:hypothetical protein SAMD00020551_3338 [Mesobacillus selenatarsenatis SF-1]|uniref:Uncharacterized protein n=1 Tax=Mesobacillus selenatarsenatis (strain DSM 18680 / JCM 14380 / FERM P-15431 / SF-1) TaxID=1321606 RepID=A0A0A8X813_MESS1|nr:hypothetical protein SAMD00020551_3338 [Mesobacillus selenatarsenatis SF-1]